MLPLLYIVRMDVEPDYLDEFVKWYDTRHGPDLIAAGFHSCNAYHAEVGGPLICNIYEIPDIAVFSGDAYVNVRVDDRQLTEEVLKKISNHSNTVFSQEATVGVDRDALRDDERPSRAGAVSAPVVSTLRFDVPAGAELQLARQFSGRYGDYLQSQAGFLRSRLLRQAGKHPLFPSSQPQWQIVNEWASLDAVAPQGGAQQAVPQLADALQVAAPTVEYTVAALSATLLNARGWTT